MSFEDYGRKKYSGQSSNEQSFTDYARGRYGTERGDAYAASQKSKEQISSALNSFVDGYKRRRAEENAALEAAKAAEKERKRQEELVKYGVKKAGSVTGSLSAIASAAEALERRLNPQRSTPENAARVLENKRRETSQIMPNGSFGKTAMPYSDRERVPAKAVETVQPEETHTGARKQRRQKGSIQSMDRRLNALSPVVSPMIETGAQEETQNSPRTVDLDNLLARGAYVNNNRLQRDADKWISTASKGAKRAAKQEGDELLYIDGAAQAEYLRAKKAYDDYVAKYDRMQGPFLDGKGNLITNDDINTRKAELKAAMDAAMDAARAEQRNALAGEYKWLANRPDFKENLQNGYRKEDQVVETTDGRMAFKSEEAQLIYNMTGAERRILTYLRNTQGKEAAKDYIAVLKPDIEKRVHNDVEKRSVELAEKSPGAAIVVRTVANLDNTIRGGAYTLKSAAAKLLGIEGAEIDPYSLSYTGGTARNAIQNNIGERLNKYFADNENVQKYLSNMGRNLGVKELSSGKAPQFVFDTIMSGVVDSTVAGVIGGAVGSTAVSAALVSGSAMVDSAREIKLQGGSDERALALGSVAGLLEYATEKIGFDRLADMITKGGKGGIRAVLSNIASEYAEEASSEIGNYLAEWAADAIEGVNMSTFRQTRQAYIDAGLSEADATRRTWTDFALQVNEAGMGGALGGAIMGGGAQVVGKVFNAVAQHEFDRAVAKAGEDGDIAAKAYKFNDDGMLRRGDYDKAFDTIWDGAANGLTLEQIEQAAPDIMALLDDKQKQGIFDAAKNDAKQKAAAELKKKTDKEYKALFGEEDAKAEADKGKQKAMQANLDDGKSADEAAKTPAVQRPQTQITQIDEAGKRTESTVFERKNTETAKQAQTEQTETQPAREHALEQHETAAEPPMSRDQTKGGEMLDRTEKTRQRGAEAVSERVSEENRGEIEAYVTDQKKTAKGGVRRSYAAKNLTRDQKGQIRILDEMGRHYGVEIEVVDSIQGGKVQGMYDGGNRIKVALDAGNQAYVQVGTHELVHYLKNRDDAGYRVVEKMVVDELSKAEGFSLEDAITERRAEYAAQDVMIDDSAAIEEIVAEALPSIWGDKRAVNAFVSQNRSLAQKVRDFIVDFVERLKQYAVDYAVDQDRTEILALQSREQDAVGTLEQIARTFDLALESAREKGENGTERTETQPAREHTTEQHETAAEPPVSRDNVEGGVRRGHTMEQDSKSENNIRVLDMIGKHYGFEFETFDATEDSNVRSTYDGGRRIKVPIYAVDSDSDFDAYVHEGTRWLTEYLKNKNETGYRVVEKMVLDVLSKAENFSLEDAIVKRRAKNAAQDVMIDDSAVIEEIVADVLPTIWGEESILMKIILGDREEYTYDGDIDKYTNDEYSLFYDLAHDVWMRNESYSRWQKAPEILVMAESGLRSNTLNRIAYAFDAAMKEALEKEQSGGQTAHSLRKDNEINLSNREYAMFREKIAEIKIGKSAQFPKSAKGEYILAIDNKLVYTDGEFVDTHVSKIIELNVGNESMTDLARQMIFDGEQEGADFDGIQGLVKICFGEGSILVDIPKNGRGNARKNGRGEGGNLQKVRKDDHGDLPSPEKRKYALRKSVEQIEDLVAVHNTTADKLKKTLDLGGFPMPSIAVTKTGIVHSNFGEITLVFGRETVDPKADKRNKVYSADAWTPTVPKTEYEANPKVQTRVSEKLRALQGKIPADYRGYLAQYTQLDDLLNRYGGQEGIVEKALTDSAMRAAYVADRGGDVTMEKKTVTEGGVSAEQADRYRRTLQLFDNDVDKMMHTPINQLSSVPGIGDVWPSVITHNANRLSRAISMTADFARGKLDERTVEVSDAAATNAKIDRQIDDGKYKAWLNELFGGAVGSEGIYNNKELYTPSGNRRSFAATHYPVTVENIVKAMAGQNGGNSKNVGGFYGVKTLRAATAETFKSVDEMHKRSERLQNMTQEEADALTDALNTRLNDIIGDIVGGTESTYNSLAKMDHAGKILAEIAETKYSAQSIRDTFARYQMPVSEALAERIKALLDDTHEMPVNLYEAKPQRAVGFDEIKAAIVPNDMDASLMARLSKVTGKILTYPAGDDAERMRLRDSVEGVKFSLKSESANKVDMDQTLRAGDNSVAEQTETQEQTRHEPVPVTETMRQWADKRAGQIIREYRSTIDADSVKADVARLVSELAEHGASSDVLNAAVNMAKGIIEKSSRLDNTLRDQYSDLRRQMRKTPIMLSDLQKQEAANITGSYGRYRQSLFGSVNLVNESNTSLDQAWEEWSEQHPELFTPGLNEGDQVARLAEIKTMFEPKYVNEYGEHLDAAAADLGMSLYSEALRMVGDAARAQQVTKDRNDMRSRYSKATREALQKVRNEQVARFKAIAGELQAARQAGDRARQDAIMNDYRANMRRAGMQQVEAEARSAYRAQFEDAAAWRKAHERTIKYARTLRQELAKPTKQKHIPAGLEKPVLDVLNRIDMSATGRDTQGARQWRDSLESIAKWLDEQDRLQTNALDESQSASEGHEGVWMAICGRNIQDLRAAINTVSGTNGRVASMSLQEINALSNAMSVINHSVNSINETWTLSRNETLNQLGDRSVSEMQKKRTNRAQDSKIPMLRELDTLLNVDQLDAVSFFERLGDVGGDVAESLTAGQSKAYERVREAADASREIFAIDGVKDERKRREMIRGWRREQHTFTLTRGTTTQDVTMSGTQLMELYALSKRNQALKHILSGGIRIAGQEGKTGDVYNYQVTQEQLDHMLGELTPEQKQVVDRMQAYLSGDVAGWGNEVTMEMYLYKAFNEKNYWPIKSDTDYKRTREQDGSVMYNALLNASWTKAVVDKPSNPITIGDAIETFAGHVSDMATYSGLAMPVDDLLKWYNYQSRDETGKADYNGSVKKEIRRTIGAVGTQYIQRLMDDLNGMGRRSYESDLIGKAISNYKRAAIMAKLRVVIQQPTAILRASALIDPKYFSGMTRGIGKNAIAEMQEHSGLAWWKSNGNYEIGTGASMKSIITGMQDTAREAIGEKLGAPAGMADDLGWVCIWQAVKRETEARHPNMEVGSDAYWNIVRNRFEDVCIRTQVVDTVLTRSQLMRSKSQLMKSVTAFMSEPTKNYNLIRNAVSAVYNAKTPDERKAAIGTLARSAAAIAAAQALNAVVTAAHDMLKYYDPDDEDEDGEEITRIDMFADNWFSDMMDGINPLANIPIIKDVYALMMGEDVERMDLAVISDVIDAIKKLDNYVAGGNTRGLNAWGAVRPLLKAIGDMTGLPASGLIADTELLLNIVSPGVTRSIQRESNTSDAYTMLYRAMAAGDTKKAASLRAKLKGGAFGKTPKSDKEIDAGVRDVLAISDDRIRRCFEMKQQGGNTKELVALQKEIAADGFTMEQVVGAVNNYARLVGRTVRDNYKAAYLVKDEKQMKLYADQAKSLGYDDDDIAGWVAEKDLDEQLSGEMYTKDDMMSYIRKGTDGDIKDVVDYRISVSSADNPEQSVRNAIASEFRDEYIELFNSGDAGGAQKLKNRLLAAGLSEKAIDGWVYTNDGLKAYLMDGQGTKEQAQDILDYKVRFSDAKKPEDSSVNALKSYRDEYIELARSDKKKAEAMAKRLIELGLSESLIDTWNDAAKEEEK